MQPSFNILPSRRFNGHHLSALELEYLESHLKIFKDLSAENSDHVFQTPAVLFPDINLPAP